MISTLKDKLYPEFLKIKQLLEEAKYGVVFSN